MKLSPRNVEGLLQLPSGIRPEAPIPAKTQRRSGSGKRSECPDKCKAALLKQPTYGNFNCGIKVKTHAGEAPNF